MAPAAAGAAALGDDVVVDDAAVEAFDVLAGAAYHVSMPLWPLHAPCLLGAEV